MLSRMSQTLSMTEKPAPRSRRTAGFSASTRIAGRKVARGVARVFPQWLRTALVLFLWLGSMGFWVSVTTLYRSYPNGYMVGVGLALCTAIAVHVWPTRTPPWRTLAITGIGTAWLGSSLLLEGAGQYALTIAAVAGLLFVGARVNQNGRRLWRLARLRPLADK